MAVRAQIIPGVRLGLSRTQVIDEIADTFLKKSTLKAMHQFFFQRVGQKEYRQALKKIVFRMGKDLSAETMFQMREDAMKCLEIALDWLQTRTNRDMIKDFLSNVLPRVLEDSNYLDFEIKRRLMVAEIVKKELGFEAIQQVHEMVIHIKKPEGQDNNSPEFIIDTYKKIPELPSHIKLLKLQKKQGKRLSEGHLQKIKEYEHQRKSYITNALGLEPFLNSIQHLISP